MKIKYVSYVGGNNQTLRKTHELIIEKLSPLNTGNESGFEFCGDYGELLKILSKSFTESEAIVLLADIADYNKTKSLLFKAMNIRCVKNPEVIAKIKANEYLSYLNEKQIGAHCAMPQKSVAFVTNDGLFSGFGIESDRQKVIVLPNDDTRADDELLEKVVSFIGNVAKAAAKDEEPTIEEAAPETVGTESEQAEIPQEPDTFEKPSEADASIEPRIVESEQNQPLYGAGGVDDLVAETFTNIGYSQIKIAFGVQEDNVIVDDYFRSKIVFRNTGLFTIVDVSKSAIEEDEMKCKADLSQIARSSMLNANASIGMAVSEVMTDENNKKFVLSAMCDSKKTNIYKVYALPDENDEDILISAVGNMFAVLNDRVMQFNERLRQKGSENAEKKSKEKKKGSVALIVLVVILAILVVAVGIAVYCYYTGSPIVYELIEKIKNFIFPQT